jgi:hypothetical protein
MRFKKGLEWPDDELHYVYRETTDGIVNFWYKDDFKNFSTLNFDDLSEHAFDKRNITIEDIEEFIYFGSLKVVWRPDYKSRSGESVRIIGEHPRLGVMSLITIDRLNAEGQIRVLNALFPANLSDVEIWNAAKTELAKIEIENSEKENDLDGQKYGFAQTGSVDDKPQC